MSGYEWLIGLAALVFAPLLGGFLRGIDRKLTARMQGRIGPPIWQQFYDFFKLIGKARAVTTKGSLMWVWGYLLLTMLAVYMLFAQRDLLIIFFILAFAGACLIFGAFSVRSPYSHIGAHREIMQMLSYEPILLLAAVAIFLQTGTFKVSGIFEHDGPLLLTLPLVFVAVLIALTIKLRKSPFDISASEHAHQELVRGVYTEYSGRFLALIELTHWYELVLILAFVALFWAQPLWIGVLLALGVYFLELLVDNIEARLQWSWMLSISWAAGIGFILVNIILIELVFGNVLRL
ncbi:MAG: NADH-quinone oxidoreductase subunit H [Candidatus Desulforudis sp.]|nr:NADH-quinone oxidoreductase subunit H [Desulforudis sp.]